MNVEKIEKEIRTFVNKINDSISVNVHKLRYDMCIEFSISVDGRIYRVFSQSFYVNSKNEAKIESIEALRSR